ncbi:hypothetical protein D9619_006981 [Psilocybe cf. subviscida]|uniref:Uncharacterized protein n=1 Tax=Psilocybe cf. subviscida TaxID=2480587 RepID=A0A8H5EWL5_9AGAR|nr:hypothetical protein D9619_006981 [Psilocybe cf. subviscida]
MRSELHMTPSHSLASTMTSASRSPSRMSSGNPDAPLLSGLAKLSALVRQTTDEIRGSCEATEERRRKSQNRDTLGQDDISTERRQSTTEASEDSSLLEIIRDEVKELVEIVEELREDPEAARMKSENAYLRRQVEYLVQKNQHDLLTTTQHILQAFRDEQQSRHAELMQTLHDMKTRGKLRAVVFDHIDTIPCEVCEKQAMENRGRDKARMNGNEQRCRQTGNRQASGSNSDNASIHVMVLDLAPPLASSTLRLSPRRPASNSLLLMEPPSFYRKPDRPALITPSASPPPLRVNDPPFLNHRGSSPPLKRQRMQSSTPLRTAHDAPSSSRTQTPVIDIQKEREASRLRLLDVWSSLAERYTRRLDEDDIVDLWTGKITRDNGVIRGSRSVAFGALGAPGAGYQTADEGSEEDDDEREDKDAEEDDEYGLDELDSFANPEDYGLETPDDVPTEIVLVPPPTLPFGPTDEADLQEFMDAERMRRDTCGTDVEDIEEADEEEETDFDQDHLGASEEEHSSCPASDFVEDEVDQEEGEEEEEFSSALPEDYYDQVVPLRYDSDEDELGNWKADDSNFTRPISAPPEETVSEKSDDEVEFVEPPIPPKKLAQARPARGSSSPSKMDQKKNQQLLTPPLSSSSYAFSETPEPVATSSKSPFRPSSSLLNEQKKAPRSVEAEKSPVKESRVEPTAKNVSSKSRHGSRSPTKPRHQPPTKPPEPLTLAELSKRPKPFVLLTTRSSTSPTKPTTVAKSSRDAKDVDENGGASTSPTKLSKGKGKEKAREEDSSPIKQSRPQQDVSRGSSSPTKRKTRHESPEPYVLHRESSGPPSSPTMKPSRTPFEEARNGEYHESSGSSVPPPQPRASSSRDALQHSSSSRNDAREATYADNSRYESGSAPPPPSKKRKRVVSDVKSHSSDYEKPAQRHQATEERRGRSRSSHRTTAESVHYTSPQKRSTSQRRHITPDTESEFDDFSSPSASESPTKHQRHRSRSRARSQLPQYQAPPPPPAAAPYGDFPVSRSHPHSHPPSHPHSRPPPHAQLHPHEYSSIPDPRAQLIIAQAMHQLSALVGGAWPQPPYSESYIPRTPSSHRHQHPHQPQHNQHRQGSQLPLPPLGSYITPSHRRPPEPYYDPDFSYATMPPDSPEVNSSPDKSSPPNARRKSIVGRSRSRGRRVSFHFDEESGTREREALQQSSPTRPPAKRGGGGSSRRDHSESEEEQRSSRRSVKGKSKEKGRARADTPAHGYVSASASDRDSELEGGSGHEHDYEHQYEHGYSHGHSQKTRKEQSSAPYVRGRTPGPDLESSHADSYVPSGSSRRRQPSRSRR